MVVYFTASLSALVFTFLFFNRRVFPRRCPSCHCRRVILVTSRRIGDIRERLVSCLACGAEFTTIDGPSTPHENAAGAGVIDVNGGLGARS